ncbi:MAG TPA: hypothetical protein VKY92_17215 [Verrucomicrobiae bacterium]|nr:hypothetical protein [Verrucomicrobiae bacterium]
MRAENSKLICIKFCEQLMDIAAPVANHRFAKHPDFGNSEAAAEFQKELIYCNELLEQKFKLSRGILELQKFEADRHSLALLQWTHVYTMNPCVCIATLAHIFQKPPKSEIEDFPKFVQICASAVPDTVRRAKSVLESIDFTDPDWGKRLL